MLRPWCQVLHADSIPLAEPGQVSTTPAFSFKSPSHTKLLYGTPDSQVVKAICVEVRQRQRRAIFIPRYRLVMPHLLAESGVETAARSKKNIDGAGIGETANIFIGPSNHQVGVAVAIDLTNRQSFAPKIVIFRYAGSIAGLGEQQVGFAQARL